jgi:uncharacterized protein (TIGR02246 family)
MTDVDQIRAIIELHNLEIVGCYASGDAESLASAFAQDAWQMPPHNPPLIGRAAIGEFWSQAFQWGSWAFTLDVLSVEVSDPIAVERGRYVLRFTAGSGAPPAMTSFEDRGHYLVHWRHETDRQWRIAADAPVSEIPLLSAGPPGV